MVADLTGLLDPDRSLPSKGLEERHAQMHLPVIHQIHLRLCSPRMAAMAQQNKHRPPRQNPKQESSPHQWTVRGLPYWITEP